MDFKNYYLQRLNLITHYSRSNFWYCLLKTLWFVIALPLFAVCFVVDCVFTLVNMLFCWIPLVGPAITMICQLICLLFSQLFWVACLPELRAYKQVLMQEKEMATEQE